MFICRRPYKTNHPRCLFYSCSQQAADKHQQSASCMLLFVKSRNIFRNNQISLQLDSIMSSSEKFSLRWNDFESNIRSSIGELRSAEDFVDVTLVCENEQINAHKVIISACSPFFRNILTRNPHKNPLVYLKGVHLSDMQSVLDFMYHGEVSVSQENLNKFLSVAEDLEVKGLTQKQSSDNKESSKSSSQSRQEQKSPRSVAHPSPKPQDSMCTVSSHQSPVSSLVKTEPKTSESSINDPSAVAKYNQEVYEEEEELYDQYDEEIQYSDQAQSLDISTATGLLNLFCCCYE